MECRDSLCTWNLKTYIQKFKKCEWKKVKDACLSHFGGFVEAQYR